MTEAAQHTPGPWFAHVRDREARIWRRDPADLYENGGSVAGDKPLASVHLGWSGEDEQGFPVVANARLLAAAPELLDALLAMMPTNMCDDNPNVPDNAVLPVDFHYGDFRRARAAIAKACGGVA